MTEEDKTDLDYYCLLSGVSTCCEEGFRQGVEFIEKNIIPQKIETAKRLAKIEILEELKLFIRMSTDEAAARKQDEPYYLACSHFSHEIDTLIKKNKEIH